MSIYAIQLWFTCIYRQQCHRFRESLRDPIFIGLTLQLKSNATIQKKKINNGCEQHTGIKPDERSFEDPSGLGRPTLQTLN